MPHTGDDDARNVVLNEMNKPFTAYALDSETMARWEHIIAVRTSSTARSKRHARPRSSARAWRPTCT